MLIGIDPGIGIVGYSLVTGNQRKPVIVDYGVIHTRPQTEEQIPFRLLEIAKDLEEILDKYRPTKAVVEKLFFFKNQKTIISVSQARGLILYLLAKKGIVIQEVTPLQVKQTLCGYGRATKSQVQKMVQKIYKLDSLPTPDDAADSLAMAWWGLG